METIAVIGSMVVAGMLLFIGGKQAVKSINEILDELDSIRE
jgi:divalent metal cation (Fe/Co/Zn/Cd) transporter